MRKIDQSFSTDPYIDMPSDILNTPIEKDHRNIVISFLSQFNSQLKMA